MAEFSDVIRQWKRMCEMYRSCSECPLYQNDESFHSHTLCSEGLITGVDKLAETENVIMAWAADHPEPVYPTWAEWLMEHGLIYAHKSRYMKPGFEINQSRVEKPIPADIAEKLGIEAKEST